VTAAWQIRPAMTGDAEDILIVSDEAAVWLVEHGMTEQWGAEPPSSEPVFVARRVRLLAAPRIMKERHIRLELAQDSIQTLPAGSSGAMRAVGWDLASRAVALGLAQGSLIDLAYRIRENEHPDFGGIEAEIAGIEIA